MVAASPELSKVCNLKATLTRVYRLFVSFIWWTTDELGSAWLVDMPLKKKLPLTHVGYVASLWKRILFFKNLTTLLAWIHCLQIVGRWLALLPNIIFSIVVYIQNRTERMTSFLRLCRRVHFLLSWIRLIAWYNLVWIKF